MAEPTPSCPLVSPRGAARDLVEATLGEWLASVDGFEVEDVLLDAVRKQK